MSNPIDTGFIQRFFPTLSEMIYLNNAGTGIPPITAINAMKQYLENRIRAKGSLEESLKLLKSVREHLAKLLGGEKRNYGLAASTSSGINAFVHGISYPKNSNIVLCDLEFPSNYIPWQNAARLYDVELRVVKSEAGAISLESFKEKVNENTRVVAVSHTQFASGYRADLKALARLVHDVGGYLVSDIIQAAGWVNDDYVKTCVDFAAGQAAKWMIGPIGAGYVYIADDVMDQLTPHYLSWWGCKNLVQFEYAEKEPYDDARKIQLGSPFPIAYVGFVESLKLLCKISTPTLEAQSLGNADYLRKRLSEVDIEHYDFGPDHNSPIVSCKPENVEKLNEELKRNHIHCSVRNGRLRVSPHFYNTHEEIDKLIERLR
jgi:selenocysteine lyase/cysteine desulfurase